MSYDKLQHSTVLVLDIHTLLESTTALCMTCIILTWSAVSSCLRSVPAAAASVASLKSSAAWRRFSSCGFSCGVLAQP